MHTIAYPYPVRRQGPLGMVGDPIIVVSMIVHPIIQICMIVASMITHTMVCNFDAIFSILSVKPLDLRHTVTYT
jgi:hypothetical protein